MAQRKLLFTWDLESFNEIAEEDNLLRLRSEFKMRRYSLSRSLLILKSRIEDQSWMLADFEDEKIYYIDQNDAGMNVLEGYWDLDYLQSRFKDAPCGTHEGFIDWLKLFSLPESDLEPLKRTDLSPQQRDVEIAHPHLLAAYELLQEILISPREWLIGLSKSDVQKIWEYLDDWFKISGKIKNIHEYTDRQSHEDILQDIFQFSDDVKQHLGQVAAYLQSKKSEQLEALVNTTVAEAMEDLKERTNEMEIVRDAVERSAVMMKKEFADLKSKMQDELAKETVSNIRQSLMNKPENIIGHHCYGLAQ